MKQYLFAGILLLSSLTGLGQNNSSNPSPYFEFYPIGDDPNVGYKTTTVPSEKILFEANPTMRFSFYNNIYRKLIRGESKGMQAWYISFRPQLRMYTDNSLPVRMPSYRILLGTQRLFRVGSSGDNLLAISLESGHYSNGQDGGAFTDKYADGSPESEAIYNTITPNTNLSKILNRRSGNFSTDLTELIVNYRINTLDDNSVPKRTHLFKAGAVLYHDYLFGLADIGGYSNNDIKIYGHWRTQLGYQYIWVAKNGQGMRYSAAVNLETIFGAHKSVEPQRLEATFTWYPFVHTPQVGFFGNFTAGHDNYNYRFVDSGSQVFFGVTWSIFPPFGIHTVGGL